MNLITTSSPHIRGNDTTQKIMRDVLLALIPTTAAGIYFFGIRVLLVCLVSILSAMAGECAYRVVTKQECSIFDLSAPVTGLLLALTLPSSVPYWVVVMGSLFAVIVVKGMGGGLGHNAFNPALAARAFLVVICPAYVTIYAQSEMRLSSVMTIDGASSATPLHEMQIPALPKASVLDMFLGNIGGSMGEVSSLAIILGGAYLIYRKVISPRIPLAYVGTVAVLTLIFSKGNNPVFWMIYSILSGGVLLGAFFMATDYASSPVIPRAQILYGVGIGALTVVFRYTGIFPEGVTYAVLMMNGATGVLDRLFKPRRFGEQKGGVKE